MTKTVDISDEAYAVLVTHARANGETYEHALDELFLHGAKEAWTLTMPEMKYVWAEFIQKKGW